MSMSISGTSGLTFPNASSQSVAATPSYYIGGQGQVFTATGTFTIPTGVTAVKVTVVGGGGGGSYSNGGGSGGAGGGAAVKFLTGLTPGNTLSVSAMGAAGAAGASTAAGGSGGTTSVSSGTQTISTISATGGGGGSANGSSTSSGGSGSGGDLNIPGQTSNPCYIVGISCTYYYMSPQAGNSLLGLGGTSGMSAGTALLAQGTVGKGYGAGGGGGIGGNVSAAGTAGVVIFEW